MNITMTPEMDAGTCFEAPDVDTHVIYTHTILGFLTSGHGKWIMYTHTTDIYHVAHVHRWVMDEFTSNGIMEYDEPHGASLLDLVHAAFKFQGGTQ